MEILVNILIRKLDSILMNLKSVVKLLLEGLRYAGS